jgi:hypothetical protein
MTKLYPFQALDTIRNLLPSRTYCANEFDRDMAIRPIKEALQMKNIALNTRFRRVALTLDIDRAGAAFAAEDAGLPAPSIVSVNPENRHAHITYLLKNPVFTGPNARDKPIKYLRAITDAYVRITGADVSYHGPTCKNPFSPAWDTIRFDGTCAYDLDYLADFVSINTNEKNRIVRSIEGRNTTLFDTLRHKHIWVIKDFWRDTGGLDAFTALIAAEAERLRPLIIANGQPQTRREVELTARSVAMGLWRIRGEYIEKTHKPEQQRARALIRWDKESQKVEGLRMMAAGALPSEVAGKLGVNRTTVFRWTKQPI